MASKGKGVMFVDAYAGANKYAGQIRGSTVIMVEAATRILEE